MSCNSTCPNLSYVNSIANSGGNLALGFSTIPSFVNTDRICFRFNNNLALPTGYEALPVVASVNVGGTITSIPVLNKYGNQMMGGQIKTNLVGNPCCRKVYTGYFGQDTTETETIEHIIVTDIPKNVLHTGCNL